MAAKLAAQLPVQQPRALSVSILPVGLRTQYIKIKEFRIHRIIKKRQKTNPWVRRQLRSVIDLVAAFLAPTLSSLCRIQEALGISERECQTKASKTISSKRKKRSKQEREEISSPLESVIGGDPRQLPGRR
jgi:hypothetical protein